MEWELINDGNMLTSTQIVIAYITLFIIAAISVKSK